MLLDARYKNPTNKGLIIWGAGILFLTCKELAGQGRTGALTGSGMHWGLRLFFVLYYPEQAGSPPQAYL